MKELDPERLLKEFKEEMERIQSERKHGIKEIDLKKLREEQQEEEERIQREIEAMAPEELSRVVEDYPKDTPPSYAAIGADDFWDIDYASDQRDA